MIVNPIPDILDPSLKLLPGMDSPKARMMLLAIGLQESRFEHRRQIGGPARGFWQFEQGGGVRGVLTHKASAYDAVKVCYARGVGSSVKDVYERLEHDDILACCFARLLLFTDPRSLPMIGDTDSAWSYYLHNWRPGRPHRQTWDEMYERGHNLLMAAQ
jgi:hypothetical protein